MPESIHGLVVIVTGATKGIGLAAAEALAEDGAKVVLCGRTAGVGPGSLGHAVASIVSHGGEAVGAVTDVSHADDVATVVDLAIDDFGRIDAVVNNAGIYAGTSPRGKTTSISSTRRGP